MDLVKMDLVKITRVVNWLTPLTKREIQSFISFVNIYCCFILGFSHHVHTLFDLTMKDVRFNWGLPQEDSFIKLKELVTLAPVIVLPDDDLKLTVLASQLVPYSHQSHNNNTWHQITFLSEVLNPVEHNYKIHDTEMLAII
jgi:hypothetical protein